ncbi:hypothetical protein LTR84_008800 [Exophiala bonariae]|uniref:GPR1/FUN34/YaaH-class plasma membrane protein n=1 Tax=Exophiala bonariae TaxID=1690606 RepID=A0AAV9MWR1_9EURO|nr:hypothetical protein LTR84_008800 [Exophiala bonariae]
MEAQIPVPSSSSGLRTKSTNEARLPAKVIERDWRLSLGNSFPIGIGGMVLALSPLSNIFLGWRGTGGLGSAAVGSYYFLGGLLMITASLFEWVRGQSFPSIVFATYGGFWLTYASTLTPFYNAAIAYQPQNPDTAATNPEFAASLGFFFLYMGLLSFVYLICAVKTNIVFVGFFAALIPTFCCLAAGLWALAEHDNDSAVNLQKTAGGFAFVTALLGWYLFSAVLLIIVDFPFKIPLGDLSCVHWYPKSQIFDEENSGDGSKD